MYDMTVFSVVQCEMGVGNHQVESVPSSRVGVHHDVSIIRSSVSYHIKILDCFHGIFAK